MPQEAPECGARRRHMFEHNLLVGQR